MSEEVKSRSMSISVKIIGPCPPWFTFQVQILEKETIKKLKTLITHQITHPESLLTVCHFGKILENDDETLEDLKINENCTLFLVLRSPKKPEGPEENNKVQDEGQENSDDDKESDFELDFFEGKNITIKELSTNDILTTQNEGDQEISDDEDDILSESEKISIVNQVTNDLLAQNLAKSPEFNLLLLKSHHEAQAILQANTSIIEIIEQNPKIFSEKSDKLEEMSLGPETIERIQEMIQIFAKNPLGFGDDGDAVEIQVEIRKLFSHLSESKFLLNPWTEDDLTPGVRRRTGKLILKSPIIQNMIKSPEFVEIVIKNHPDSQFDSEVFKKNLEKILSSPKEVLDKLGQMIGSKVDEDSDSDVDSDVDSDDSSDENVHFEDHHRHRRNIPSAQSSNYSDDDEDDYQVISNIEDYSGVRARRLNRWKSTGCFRPIVPSSSEVASGEDSSDEDSSNEDPDKGEDKSISNEDPGKLSKSDQKGAGDSSSTQDTQLLILIDENIEEPTKGDENCEIGEKRKFSGDGDSDCDKNPRKLLKTNEDSTLLNTDEAVEKSEDETEGDSDDDQTSELSSEESDEENGIIRPPTKKIKIEKSPEEIYSAKLGQLQAWGFFDREANIEVLAFTKGNINAASEILIALGKRVSKRISDGSE